MKILQIVRNFIMSLLNSLRMGRGQSTIGNTNRKTIVTIGDSNMWYPDESITPTANQWITLLASRKELSINNQGWPGKSSATMLAEFDAKVIANKPDIAIIEEGGNDALGWVTGDITMANIQAMCEKCFAAGIKPVIMGATPLFYSAEYVDARPSLSGKNRIWEDTNYLPLYRSLVKTYCQAKNIPYVDVYTDLLNPDGTQNTSLNAADKIHMNATGHLIVYRKFCKLFNLTVDK